MNHKTETAIALICAALIGLTVLVLMVVTV